jgi:hypothetical protein
MFEPIIKSSLRIISLFLFAASLLFFPKSAQTQSIPTTLGWYQIPNTTLRTVCAVNNGFPQVAGIEGCDGITNDWNGGAFDTKRNRLVIWGGGHNGYYGNELYALDLNNLTMNRLTDPGLPTAAGSSTCLESLVNGTQPNSRHTYNGLSYIPFQDKFFVHGGSLAKATSGCTGGEVSRAAWTFDFASMTWTNQNPTNTNLIATFEGHFCDYDPNSSKVFCHDGAYLYSYDPIGNSWTRQTASSGGVDYHMTGVIDPVRKVMWAFGGGQQWKWDISTGSAGARQSVATTGGSNVISSTYPGIAYDPVQDRIVSWVDGNTVYILNPDTGVWSTQTYTGGPTATPNGTHGRFRYAPALNVFVVCTDVDVNCNTLRLTSGSGTPPPPSSFDFALSNGGSRTVTQGQSVSNTVTANLLSGTTQTAGFAVSGLPSGATGTFTQTSCAPTCSTTLNISTLSTTPTGNYTVNVTSIAGSLTKSTAFALAVNAPTTSFDFSLSNGGNVSATQGQSTANTITSTLVSGATQSAGFSVSGIPSGATGTFTQTSCAPTCSTTLNISTLSTTPAGNYTVNVTSVAGSLTKSTAFTLTVNTSTSTVSPSGSTDFQARCGGPGVIKCVSFDSQTDIAGTYGDIHGTLPGNSTPVLDSTVKASGNSSIKFTIPSNSGANSSGSYFTNFSDTLTTQFGGNSEFYIQWRQRFSPEFISTLYQGGGGWKQSIIGTGDKPGCTASQSASGLCYSSCTALETVTQNTNQRGFAQMYNSCTGSTSHGPYDGFYQSYGTYDFKLQNGRPSPYCLYSQGQTNPKSYFPPTGNCFGYFANEWMTFQVHIKTGPRVNDEFTNSFVQLWIARENQPSELVINWGPYNLSAGPGSDNQQFGKVWLLPYNTGKDASQSYPTAYTWYDDLIISTSKIPDPASSGGGTATTPPAAPTALTLQ